MDHIGVKYRRWRRKKEVPRAASDNARQGRIVTTYFFRFRKEALASITVSKQYKFDPFKIL